MNQTLIWTVKTIIIHFTCNFTSALVLFYNEPYSTMSHIIYYVPKSSRISKFIKLCIKIHHNWIKSYNKSANQKSLLDFLQKYRKSCISSSLDFPKNEKCIIFVSCKFIVYMLFYFKIYLKLFILFTKTVNYDWPTGFWMIVS